MTDELDVLRAADPVRADAGPWRDRPLDARAEFALHRLLTSKRARQAGRRLVLRAEAAVLVLVAVLAYTFSGAGAAPAAAAPPPIVPRGATGSVPLETLAHRAEEVARSAGKDAGPRRGSHLQTWYLSMETRPDAAPPDTVPQERISRWRPDGSGSELVAAIDARHPGKAVIDDSGGSWRTVNNGEVLRRTTYPAGSRAGGNAAGPRPGPRRSASTWRRTTEAPARGRRSSSRRSPRSCRSGPRGRARPRRSSACWPAPAGFARPARSPTVSAATVRRTSTTGPTAPWTPPGRW